MSFVLLILRATGVLPLSLCAPFLQTELQKLVGNLRTLNGEASREPPVEKAQDWLTMLSSWTAASARKVASEMKTEREVNPFKMLAEEGVAGVNGFVSSLVEEVEARLDDDQVLELFHSQGLLDQVRAGCAQVADARCFRRQRGGEV